jgi:hypothetical protein
MTTITSLYVSTAVHGGDTHILLDAELTWTGIDEEGWGDDPTRGMTLWMSRN